MNAAVFVRTFLDQVRVRTYVFLLLLMAVGFMAGWGPTAAFDDWVGHDGADVAEDRARLTGAFSLAALFAFPLFNVKLILMLFAVLTSVSATATEWQERTMFLLFSKPVPRWKIVMAKVFGAYAWVAIGVALMGISVAVGAAVAGATRLGAGQFLAALAWIALATFPLVVISATFGVVVRKSIPAVFVSLLVLGLVGPVVGQAGFFIAMQDDEFANEGIYQAKAVEEVFGCGADVDLSSNTIRNAETQQELEAAWRVLQQNYAQADACRDALVGDVDAFYESRGVSAERFHYEVIWCETTQAYEAWPENDVRGRFYAECWNDGDYRRHSEHRDALASKFERPLVDAPRFLSPTTLMAAWQPVAGWSSDDAPEEVGELVEGISMFEAVYGQNGIGAAATPHSVVGSVVGLILHALVWPLLAAWAINRRDLS